MAYVPFGRRTGAIASADAGLAELAEALRVAEACDPAACRAHVRASFSADRMVAGSEAIYRDLAAGRAAA